MENDHVLILYISNVYKLIKNPFIVNVIYSDL